VPENPGKKDSVVDVRCTDQRGRQFIVEMQLYWNEFFQQRVLLNASKAVVRQLDKGMNYKLIQPVYCLNLVNDIGFESDPDEFYHDYAIVNVEHSDRIIEGLRFVYVELPKFKPKTIAEKKMAVLWLRFLTEINLTTESAPAELLENELTKKALSIVERSAMSEAQLNSYEKYWINLTDEEGIALARYNRGVKDGMAQGMAQGEQKKAMSVARNLKLMNLPVADIAKATGLTKEDIDKL
jgi:predicted transposase/invertase (TIGR01784 family)